MRASLSDRQASWTRELALLRTNGDDLRRRLARSEGSPRAAGADATALHQRTEAVLAGSEQSLVDLARQIGQTREHVQQALDRGSAAGLQVLEEDSARITSVLEMIRTQIEATGRELAVLDSKEGRARVEGLASAGR